MSLGDAMSCQELVELVTAYLEGALGSAPRRRLQSHLAQCPGCERYLDQMRETLRLAGRLEPEDLPPEAREALRAAFRAWRDERD
jgi:predicted anti-sigma-YlaC factor YlaD